MNISAPPPEEYATWRSSLLQHIASSEQHRFFWLVDSCAHDSLPGLIWQLDAQPDAWPLYMNTYLEESVNSGPFMVPYRHESGFTRWMLEELRLTPLGCLIEVEAVSVHAAFEHLQNCTECLDAENKRSIFRFYDPRILYGISTYQDITIKLRILGPVLRLFAWEPGRCVPVSLGNGLDSGKRNAGLESYDAAFFEHVWEETAIHSIIGTLGRESGMTLRAMPLPEAYSLVGQVAHILSLYGYNDRRSLAYGSSVTARRGLEIWERPDLRDGLLGRTVNMPLDEILNSVGL